MAPDDLDELHERNGVHEMNAQEPIAPAAGAPQGRDRNGGRVARQDGVGRAEVIELAKELLLERQILGDSFNHKIRTSSDPFKLIGWVNPIQCFIDLIRTGEVVLHKHLEIPRIRSMPARSFS